MKTLTSFATIAPAVVIAAFALSSCREALYPVARAFGSPPESELAVCREAFRQLQMHIETSRVQVEPVGGIPGQAYLDAGRGLGLQELHDKLIAGGRNLGAGRPSLQAA